MPIFLDLFDTIPKCTVQSHVWHVYPSNSYVCRWQNHVLGCCLLLSLYFHFKHFHMHKRIAAATNMCMVQYLMDGWIRQLKGWCAENSHLFNLFIHNKRCVFIRIAIPSKWDILYRIYEKLQNRIFTFKWIYSL